MSHDDLATLLREDVTATEPSWSVDPTVPVRLGRRRLRTRRLVSSAAVVGVLAVGGAVAVPQLHGDLSSGPSRGVDPAGRPALDHYDAQQMPRVMDDRVRAVLERSVPDLGPVIFRAGDGQGEELPPELYDKASGMSVRYGTDEHSWSVSLNHSPSEVEGSAEQYCPEGMRDGIYLDCTIDTLASGEVVISKLEAIRPMGRDQFGTMWAAVKTTELGSVDAARLWFERVVKVKKSDTLVSYASERVKAPDVQAAEAIFRTPIADLIEIGTDPNLVMPEPPTDDSGCGPWTLDPGVFYACGGG